MLAATARHKLQLQAVAQARGAEAVLHKALTVGIFDPNRGSATEISHALIHELDPTISLVQNQLESVAASLTVQRRVGPLHHKTPRRRSAKRCI